MCGILVAQDHSEKFKSALDTIKHRGPDNQTIKKVGEYNLGFNRLSIMDLSDNGNQPFQLGDNSLVCNGEIYNYRELMSKTSNYIFESDSDCEVILPLLEKFTLESVCLMLDAEFAFVVVNKNGKILAARDPIGIRPLFYGYVNGEIAFASEVKTLQHLDAKGIKAFPPGNFYDGKNIKSYRYLWATNYFEYLDKESAKDAIKDKLIEGVRKRLTADAPVGFLLSGGLDSSLVCAIASKILNKPLKTFAVGLDENPIDLKYAKIVADHIGSEHQEIIFTKDDTLRSITDIILTTETWDVTTIRASIGMYLLCKWIKKNTNIKVLLTGEISDELFGYKYTDFAPNAYEFQLESKKRLRELHAYDVLRADRCISAHSIEARVPFGDLDFVEAVMKIHPDFKMNKNNMGKSILREAFRKGDYLPESILYRDKAAFSDAVGHGMVECIQEFANSKFSDQEFQDLSRKYVHGRPLTKEALLYRQIFDSLYPGKAELIPDFWLPNKNWKNCNVIDPSARVLPNYGKSGE